MKFGRTYKLFVQVEGLDQPNNTVEIDYPLSTTFDIVRNTLASANRGRFQIVNLKESTRRQIFHDRYDTTTYRQILFRAGYESFNPLPIAFLGNIISAYSYRQGQDWITDIEAFDGGFGIINSQANFTAPSGSPLRSIFTNLLQTMQQTSQGVIGDYSKENTRGQTFMGSSWDVMSRLVQNSGGGNLFIDLEKVNILKPNEYIPDAEGIVLLSSDTGLLNTPRRHDARIDLDIIFEPRIVVGQLVQVQSLETINNGTYQVIGVQHRGVISGALAGTAITTVSVWAGTERLKAAA